MHACELRIRRLAAVACLAAWLVPFTPFSVAAPDTGSVASVIDVRYPQVPPILPAPGTASAPVSAAVDPALVKALQSSDFAAREGAVAKLVQIGEPALPALRELVRAGDPDAAWWARAAVQEIEAVIEATGKDTITPEVAAAGIQACLARIATGPTPDTLALLRGLRVGSAAMLVDMHLRLELGMDCLYSMRPRQVLPRAVYLLEVQKDPFYQALLLRLIRNVLERAILPVPGASGNRGDDSRPVSDMPGGGGPQEGIRYLAANPAMVATVRSYLSHPLPLLRREALLIMAWGQVELTPAELEALLKDPAPELAREARALRGVFAAGAKLPPDAEATAWIKDCIAALAQDQDRLAQLGAFYALRETALDYPGELDRALGELPDGRAKDAITWLLSADPAGRLLLMRRGVTRFAGQCPATLKTIQALADYDLRHQGLKQLLALCKPEALALAWRNITNDAACGYSYGQGSARPPNADTLALIEPFGVTCDESTGLRIYTRPERLPDLVEFTAWYEACARTALSTRLSLATGAVRGLLVSDLAGARALVRQYAPLVQALPEPTTARSFPRDLLLLHPCVGLLPQAEVGQALRDLWQMRTVETVPSVSTNNDWKLPGLPVHVPLALWGFLMKSDCKYMHPVGLFLNGQLTLRHLPLLLAFLEYNPRSTIFMAVLDSAEAVPAIRREVLSRRTNYDHSYDHDLFHGVAHFTILDAAPVLESYTKASGNWPNKGIITLAGYEESRYCWEAAFVSGKPSPLAAGALRELQIDLKAGRRAAADVYQEIPAYCEKGLDLMGLPAAAPEPATAPASAALPGERPKGSPGTGAPAVDARARLQQLRVELDRQNGTGKGVNSALPTEIVAFLATDALDKQLAIDGYELLVRTYHSRKELDKERETFLRYLDLYEAKWGAEKAAEQVRSKVDALVHGEHDEALALTYADIILKRYSKSSLVPYAIHRQATYYQHLGQISEALKVFQQLEDEYPGVPETRAAIMDKSRMLFNAGRHDEAYAVLEGYITSEPLTADKAQARFTIGFCKYTARDSAGAVKEFNQTIAEFPGTNAAKQAEGMLKLINQQTAESPKPKP